MNLLVGISDSKASGIGGDMIVTYSLGSCIGVAAHDPVAKVSGILHFQLPDSGLDRAKAARNPCMFADTGLSYLLASMGMLGAARKRLVVRLVGAAEMLNDRGLFDIGRRNRSAIKSLLAQQGMTVAEEQLGGRIPRSMYLRVDDGELTIKTQGYAEAV